MIQFFILVLCVHLRVEVAFGHHVVIPAQRQAHFGVPGSHSLQGRAGLQGHHQFTTQMSHSRRPSNVPHQRCTWRHAMFDMKKGCFVRLVPCTLTRKTWAPQAPFCFVFLPTRRQRADNERAPSMCRKWQVLPSRSL